LLTVILESLQDGLESMWLPIMLSWTAFLCNLCSNNHSNAKTSKDDTAILAMTEEARKHNLF